MNNKRLLELAGVQLNEQSGKFLFISVDRYDGENSKKVTVTGVSPQEAMAYGMSKIHGGKVDEEMMDFVQEEMKKGKEFFCIDGDEQTYLLMPL